MIRAIAVSILLLVATPALALEDADYSAAVAATAKDAIIPGYQAFGKPPRRCRRGSKRCARRRAMTRSRPRNSSSPP